ncbi:hypothetical protein Dred_0497 [Desulforamulus reducens MI-1]|uniref:Uncharacterized protein n=1 Tax=Desulforamulus reducens (strain ATCC BAA-1160 / DSM 100696 / MI-1) TaxID=349161 RepID=A4J1T9_DESRM|nr:hypothetical protein [Desulforamulus reducens]ABO49042.1 hypothetical protein Dred_0497 [Desulforamulus reducens MI-1]
MLKVNVALANLHEALQACGLGEAKVVISCHNLTPGDSQIKAKELAVSGFGERLVEENQVHRYSHRPGGFSWLQLEEERAKINFFYNLNSF